MGKLRVISADGDHSDLHDEGKDARNGVCDEGQRLLEETQCRSNDVNKKCIFQVQSVPLRNQQRSVVWWERFLPVKTINVLLVENDDSTRYLLTALLRNSSYQVTDVSHGLEAWKALEDPSNRIDLVLTEVVTPYLSGMDLLSKILSHKSFSSIPVIMMSSNASVDMVLKCLSNGSVDFIVKPIQKNELKHLWQHVWRKCNTSSFSGNESGVLFQKPSSGSENDGHEGNKNGSSGEDDSWNIYLNVENRSDNESDTKIPPKRVVEVDSQRPIMQCEPLGDPTHTTCAVGTFSRSQTRSENWVPGTAAWETNEEGDNLVAMGKYLEIGVPKNQDLQVEEPNRKMQKTGMSKSKVSDTVSKKDREKFEKRVAKFHTETEDFELSKEFSDFVVCNNSTAPLMESVTNEGESYRKTCKDKTTDYINERLRLELDLNSQPEPDARPKNSDLKQKVLRHSDLSAFSRYNTSTNIKQAPAGNVGSCSPPENSSRHNLKSNMDGTRNQCSNGSSNNDMGSTTDNNIFSEAAAFSEKKLSDAPTSAHLSSAFHSLENLKDQSILPEVKDKTEHPKVQASFTEQQVKVQHRHHYHHYHHHHHHVHNGQQTQQLPDHDNLSMRNTAASASHFTPSKVLNSPNEGNAAYFDLNKSASGSNNGRNNNNIVQTAGSNNGRNDNNIFPTAGSNNRRNNNNTVRTAEGRNLINNNGVIQKCRADDGRGNDVDQNNSTQREAALLKFRQKRNYRCFEKKVRYQGRKILAEQRPRLKGQFIGQVAKGDKNEYPKS